MNISLRCELTYHTGRGTSEKQWLTQLCPNKINQYNTLSQKAVHINLIQWFFFNLHYPLSVCESFNALVVYRWTWWIGVLLLWQHRIHGTGCSYGDGVEGWDLGVEYHRNFGKLEITGIFWSSFLTINQLCFISTYYQLSLQTRKDVISL